MLGVGDVRVSSRGVAKRHMKRRRPTRTHVPGWSTDPGFVDQNLLDLRRPHRQKRSRSHWFALAVLIVLHSGLLIYLIGFLRLSREDYAQDVLPAIRIELAQLDPRPALPKADREPFWPSAGRPRKRAEVLNEARREQQEPVASIRYQTVQAQAGSLPEDSGISGALNAPIPAGQAPQTEDQGIPGAVGPDESDAPEPRGPRGPGAVPRAPIYPMRPTFAQSTGSVWPEDAARGAPRERKSRRAAAGQHGGMSASPQPKVDPAETDAAALAEVDVGPVELRHAAAPGIGHSEPARPGGKLAAPGQKVAFREEPEPTAFAPQQSAEKPGVPSSRIADPSILNPLLAMIEAEPKPDRADNPSASGAIGAPKPGGDAAVDNEQDGPRPASQAATRGERAPPRSNGGEFGRRGVGAGQCHLAGRQGRPARSKGRGPSCKL